MRKKKILIILITLFTLGTMVSGAYLLYFGYYLTKRNDELIQNYQSMHIVEDISDENNNEGKILPEFESLLKANSDTIGWLNISALGIDMPVFYHKDNPEYYLRRTPEGKYSSYGSLFLSSGSTIIPMSQKLVIYGHNMKNGRMFGKLKKFSSTDFIKKNPLLSFNTLYEKNDWKIIAVCKFSIYTDQTSQFDYRKECITKESFDDFIYTLRTRSLVFINDNVKYGDNLLMLSTCDYDFQGERFVVVARKIRDKEEKNIDTSNYKKNPLVKLPDECYQENKCPTQEALKSNYNDYFLGFLQ